jgi:DNA (cytosine-5)-methyltransferase 1
MRTTVRGASRPRKVGTGTKDAKSRYSKLAEQLDRDLFNTNWYETDTHREPRGPRYTFVDLFAGAGGLGLGFTQARYEKLFSNEINPWASATIRRNFPGSTHIERAIENVADSELIDAGRGGEVDVLIGGPPCQGFSIAGHRRTDDPRNVMFRQFVRVLKLLRPSFLLMENVPGILTMRDGAVRDAIIAEFEEAGYTGVSVRVLEAAKFGVPQLRTRAIFVANRHGLKNPYPLPLHTPEQYVPIESAIADLADKPRCRETNHEWTAHSKAFERRISRVKPGDSLYPHFKDAFKRQYLGVPCMTIKENHGGTHIHPVLDRCISAREMARLQTFPDDFIFEGSHKKAFWQIGNAVPVLLAKHLALALRDALSKTRRSKN